MALETRIRPTHIEGSVNGVDLAGSEEIVPQAVNKRDLPPEIESYYKWLEEKGGSRIKVSGNRIVAGYFRMSDLEVAAYTARSRSVGAILFRIRVDRGRQENSWYCPSELCDYTSNSTAFNDDEYGIKQQACKSCYGLVDVVRNYKDGYYIGSPAQKITDTKL